MVANRQQSSGQSSGGQSNKSSSCPCFYAAIRSMVPRDFRYVVAIDNQAFGEPCVDEGQLRHLYRLRNIVLRVATVEGMPVGYCVTAMHRGMYEVTRIAVLPDLQRRGLGAVLIDELRAKLRTGRSGRRSLIVAAVPDDNLNGMLFFREMGFKCTGAMGHESFPGEALRVMEFNVLGWVKERRELAAGECSGV